jgi:hypothetical protein
MCAGQSTPYSPPHPTPSPTCTPIASGQGPSVTSISSLIAPALDQYVELITFEFEDKPYVFCTKDATRCQTSSQWSAYCKNIFKKWSGVACPPKMLRASFVTWIRSTDASPEILKQAARAMRHQKATADSDKCT